MQPKQKPLNRILSTAILKIVDDFLWESTEAYKKEIPNLNAADRTIVLTECSICKSSNDNLTFQSVREIYAFGIMNTYTIAYNIEEDNLVGLMSVNKVVTYKTEGLISKHKVYKLSGPIDSVKILDASEMDPTGLFALLGTVMNITVVEADQNLSPRFIELINRCKEMHLKGSTDECSTVINSN